MNPDAKPIKIAIILDQKEAEQPLEVLPLWAERQPPIHIELIKVGAQLKSAKIKKLLSKSNLKQFDLILDYQDRVSKLPEFSPEELKHLITGSAAQALGVILCEFGELRFVQEINQGILDTATDAIVTINEDHIIVGYNRGAEVIFGYSREEALNQDLKIIIPPPYKDKHRDFLRRYLATREAKVIGKHVQLTAQRRDGSEFPMSISFSVAEIRDKLYFTGIIRDITEYKKMEDRLIQAERLAAMGNTVSHIAHEIKNPLLIIGGFAKQLLKTPGLEAKALQKLTIITEEVSRLEGLLGEMRDFVRPAAARKSPGRLDLLLDETLELFDTAFKEQHIAVRRLSPEALLRLNFDSEQLRRVLINLFKNALEAMPQGGELTIATRVQGNQAEVSISDTGEGMTPEVQANIFQPYFSTKEKGTGLGLAICKNIVEEHGGCLIADSQPGQGSTFTIQIPLDEGPPE